MMTRLLFEFLILDGFQAGLSWEIVLKKRSAFRAAFDNFDPHKIVQYDEKKLEELVQNAGIIRNRLKIAAVLRNAAAFIKIQEEFGSFDAYIWQFVGGKPIAQPVGETFRYPRSITRSPKNERKPEIKGLQVCWTGYLLCVHAGSRDGE